MERPNLEAAINKAVRRVERAAVRQHMEREALRAVLVLSSNRAFDEGREVGNAQLELAKLARGE